MAQTPTEHADQKEGQEEGQPAALGRTVAPLGDEFEA